jgi:DNA (cytosine-5)-methyltransferase 1
MRHGSLFSGIGGFDLASSWMGWENVFHCEKEEFPRKVLNYYWPNAESYEDIKTTDFTVWRGKCEILSGGFPCQPFSNAGNRKGTDDDRYLWPEYLRAIREIKPTYVVGENVSGLTTMDGGSVLEGILTDLVNEGYRTETFIIPAAAVQGIHRRDRLWIIAYSESGGTGGISNQTKTSGASEGDQLFGGKHRMEKNDESSSDSTSSGYRGRTSEEREIGEGELLSGKRKRGKMGSKAKGRSGESDNGETITNSGHAESSGRNISEGRQQHDGRGESRSEPASPSSTQPTTNSEHEGLQGNIGGELGIIRGEEEPLQGGKSTGRDSEAAGWGVWPAESPICGRDDALPSRLVGITFSKHRIESLKAYGNAVVPTLVYEIFNYIEQLDESK